jgi:hypothetical protein
MTKNEQQQERIIYPFYRTRPSSHAMRPTGAYAPILSKALVSGWLVITCLAGCSDLPAASTMASTHGVVVDTKTGAPIEGATVILQISVSANFHGPRCAHIDTAVSDKSGEFSMPGWFHPLAVERTVDYLVYKPGYRWDGIADEGRKFSMSPATDRVAHLEQLNDLVSATSCLGDVKPSIVHIYESVLEEERTLVRTEEERKRFLPAAEGALDDERQRLMSMPRSY